MIDRMMWDTKARARAWVRAQAPSRAEGRTLTGSTTGREISGHEVTK
jgi:heme-degrading monooxygenase HmoA